MIEMLPVNNRLDSAIPHGVTNQVCGSRTWSHDNLYSRHGMLRQARTCLYRQRTYKERIWYTGELKEGITGTYMRKMLNKFPAFTFLLRLPFTLVILAHGVIALQIW